MEFVAKVREIYAQVEENGWPQNEATTCNWIIHPVLEAIGYSKFDVTQQEVDAGGNKPDFTVMAGKPEAWFLEAKAWSVSLTDLHAIQTVNYANTKGKRWAVLTNGREWRLYDVHLASKPASERAVLVTSYIKPDFEVLLEAVSKLRVLSKETDSVVRMGMLPHELRRHLADQKSPVFKALLQKMRTEGMADLRSEELASVLLSILDTSVTPQPKAAVSEVTATFSVDVETSGDKEKLEIPLSGPLDFRYCEFPAFEFAGKIVQAPSFAQFMYEVLRAMMLENLKIPDIESSEGRPQITRNAELAKSMRKAQQIEGPDGIVFYEAHRSATSHIQVMVSLLKLNGYPLSNLVIRCSRPSLIK